MRVRDKLADMASERLLGIVAHEIVGSPPERCRLLAGGLDGDLYQSTLESLHYLYPFLSVGGHVVVDDFTDWEGCRQAVLDFRDAHGIESADEGLQVTWHDLRFDPARGEYTRGVWWTKQREVAYDPLDEGRPVFYGDGGMALRLLSHTEWIT